MISPFTSNFLEGLVPIPIFPLLLILNISSVKFDALNTSFIGSYWLTLRAVFAESFTIFNKFDEYKAELIVVFIPFVVKSPETVKSSV